MKRVLITTVPFGEEISQPLDLLKSSGVDFVINPLDEKLSEVQLAELIPDFDAIIAGTEPITDFVLSRARDLKLISRVGTGVDNVDLLSAKKRGVKVCHTPDAPGPAVVELTIGLMIMLLRHIHISNGQLHNNRWKRFLGQRISQVVIGIIGAGRIGSGVLHCLQGFGPSKILVNDILPKPELQDLNSIEWAEKDFIYRNADLISLHVPLTKRTKNMINKEHLNMMKPGALIINTSRGGIINEKDLYNSLVSGHISGAAIDAFDQEPYSGPLRDLEQCILTAHMGSMSVDCRSRMEIEATEEVIRFFQGVPLQREVPKSEYDIQEEGL